MASTTLRGEAAGPQRCSGSRLLNVVALDRNELLVGDVPAKRGPELVGSPISSRLSGDGLRGPNAPLLSGLGPFVLKWPLALACRGTVWHSHVQMSIHTDILPAADGAGYR